MILSQLRIKNIKLRVQYGDDLVVTTEDLFVKAYNEKSSLIVTVKDPNLGIKTSKEGEFLHFLTDFQVMLTRNTLSLSKLKIVKDTSFFVASGNLLYRNSPENITEMSLNTRINSSFADLKKWSNVVHKNTYFEDLKGEIKTDINVFKKSKNADFSAELEGDLEGLHIGKLHLGSFNLKVQAPSKDKILINKVTANLAGGNKVVLNKPRATEN